jgi:hypothetical protein
MSAVRTDELIRGLAADHAVPGPSLGRRLALSLIAGFILSALAFWITLGPRSDLAAAAISARFDFKLVVTLLLALLAGALAWRLAHPGRETRGFALALIAVPLILVVAIASELALVPAAQWRLRLIGNNAAICLIAIPLLSLPLLAAALHVMRLGAAVRPVFAGAVAGLLAGALGAALYAIHCPDDSPLFVATWYGIAIAAVTAVGAQAGRLMLRW